MNNLDLPVTGIEAKIIPELETIRSTVEAWATDKLSNLELLKNLEFAARNLRDIIVKED